VRFTGDVAAVAWYGGAAQAIIAGATRGSRLNASGNAR